MLSPRRQALFEAMLADRDVVIPPADRIPRREAARADGLTRSDDLPLSFAQERLWFLDKLLSANDLFNLSSTWRFTYPVNIEILQESLNELTRRHESLRTTFGTVDGEPVQIVHVRLEPTLSVVELENHSEIARDAAVLRRATEDAQLPFDLERGPLFRVTLVHLQGDDYVLLVTMHHIISDGWSLALFWDDLLAIWTALDTGQPSPLPELEIQYADFAVWQRRRSAAGALQTDLEYWKGQLSNLSVLELPTDRSRPAVQTSRGSTHRFSLTAAQSEALRSLSRAEGATIFMTLLAAFQTMLYRYSGQSDISVGTLIANRNRAETERLIGFFVNALVLRADFSGHPTFRELLKQVREMTLDAYAHQDLPFAMLVRELQPERDFSRNPLFQVVFQLLNVPGFGEDDPELAEGAESLEVPNASALFDLTFTFLESPQRLVCDIE
jgi:hypothetical protein